MPLGGQGVAFEPKHWCATGLGTTHELQVFHQALLLELLQKRWVSKPIGSHFGWQVNSPPILEPILVGIGMFMGYGILTHGQMETAWFSVVPQPLKERISSISLFCFVGSLVLEQCSGRAVGTPSS